MAVVSAIKVNMRGDEAVQKLFRTAPDVLRDVMTAEVTERTLQLLDKVRSKASGNVIGVDTGKLLASIRPSVSTLKTLVRGRVRSSGVKYFGVVNFGGRLQARDIAPKKAGALHFLMGQADVFASIVHHPAYTVKKHEIMYSSLDEMRAETGEALRGAVAVAIEKAKG